MKVYGFSTQGKRDYQQDNYLIDLDRNVFGVADGMGGHQNGDLASQDVIDSFTNLKLVSEEGLKEAMHLADAKCRHRQDRSGSTATFLAMLEDEMIVAHVGDSRCYICDKDNIQQISDDHAGLWGRLTNYVGELEWIDLYQLKSPPENLIIVICTDGVSGSLSPEAIFSIVSLESTNPAKALVQLAIESDSSDNCTALVIKL
jgi:serine/threonine protein phosphatase PrpC